MTTLTEWADKNGITMDLERIEWRADYEGEGIHYNVTLNRHRTAQSMRFQFSTGIGWVKNIKTGERAQGYHWDTKHKQAIPDNARLQWEVDDAARKFGIQRPEIDDILESLASEASSYECTRNFEDWCSDLGYDSDSRKSEMMYRQLGDEVKQLKQLLGIQLFNELVLDE